MSDKIFVILWIVGFVSASCYVIYLMIMDLIYTILRKKQNKKDEIRFKKMFSR